MSIRSRQTLSTSVSRKVVAYLGRRGLTHRAIAEMIGEREGFIRLVSEREYGLTCRDMVLIAAGTGMQLG